MANKYHLYFDDTGTRDPDNPPYPEVRDDAMDCFGLGGVLIREEDIDTVVLAHKTFCREHDITYPLHSSSIRGGRKKFGWLKNPEKAVLFYADLEAYLLSLPIITIACVVHRPGYLARYREKYQERIWLMCKTAFSILIERAAKYVDDHDGAMEVYFEKSGKKEDRDIIQYMRDLKTDGLAFDEKTSGGYTPLAPEDFRRLCLGKPIRKSKKTPMIQIADLVLFPMAKAGYDSTYRPYVSLKQAGKLIDCTLEKEAIPLRGVKYSCFGE